MQRRTARHGGDDSREFGSVAWQRRREAALRHYSRERELKRFYRILPRLKEEIDRITASGATETGRPLAALMVTVLELETALFHLHGMQRVAWRLCVMGLWRNVRADGTWEEVRLGRVSLERAGELLGMEPKAVGMHVSRATKVLIGRVYDPMHGVEEAA